MPTCISKNASRDIHLTKDGIIATVNGTQAYANVIDSLVNTILGEVQSNVNYGINYFATVFSSVRNIQLWEADVRNNLRRYPFVYSIDKFDAKYVPETKTLKWEMTVSTDLGVVHVGSSKSED